jgi:glyoxylase-like metal-dependent hydrolase (beta-lactamase superfamily II)
MKRNAVVTIPRRLAMFLCFGLGVVTPSVVSAQREASPLVGHNEPGHEATILQQRELTTASLDKDDRAPDASVLPGIVGAWTYAGTGTVNTYWIATPGGGIVVIDVQRDLVHAAEALAAVRAVGKPVRAILITHPHPDHYTGIGLFRQAFPGVVVYASQATADTIRNDTYGASAATRRDAPSITPQVFVPPGETFDGNIMLQIDGLTIVARELGRGEAHSTTAYYLPATQDLFVGDAVLNRLHGPILEAASGSWLGILDRLETTFPYTRTVHPGHGTSGPPSTLYEDERVYLRTCRKIAAEEIARSGFTEAAKQAAVERINARFPYVNPTGIKDIVRSSVDGLFQELSTPNEAPVQ